MKPAFISGAAALVIGIVMGLFIPVDPTAIDPTQTFPATSALSPSSNISASTATSNTSASTSNHAPPPTPFDETDKSALVSAAFSVAEGLRDEDYEAVSTFVSTEQGVTFTPYSTVDETNDLTLTAEQVKHAATDTTIYTWGMTDGRGNLIQMTILEYFDTYVFNADYTQAPQIGINQMIMGGNALENLTQAYPGCQFVDFCYPSIDAANMGLDWCSMKLVFQAGKDSWQLIAIVHGEWTI